MTVKCMGFGPKENKDKFFIYTLVSGVKELQEKGNSPMREGSEIRFAQHGPLLYLVWGHYKAMIGQEVPI
ncbi:hypothetical protein HPB47_018288 [Ixodes persulcatus]|uniref:Uncharacterized protein n=1 Tax=Ixodes persulcatus TaxID=34615 RepID=A0AC60QLB7_IXOPE|nr:hypothetical protein HPB47_018288 [Ixodes persulcatus]